MKKLLSTVIPFLILAIHARSQSITLTTLTNQPYVPLSNSIQVSPDFAWNSFEVLVENFGFNYPTFASYELKHIGFSEGQVDLLDDNFDTDLTLRPFSSIVSSTIDKNYDESLSITENSNRPNSSTCSYTVSKIGPLDVLKIEWNAVKQTGSSTSDSVSFQIWCYSNGVLEYRYGPRYFQDSGSFNNAIEVSMFEESISGMEYHYSLNGNPNSPNLIENPTKTEVLDLLPKPGTVYRFIPSTVNIDDWVVDKYTTIYPNPSTSGVFYLEPREKIYEPWEVYSSTGAKLIAGKGSIINLVGYSKGMYILKMGSTSQKLFIN